MNIKAKTALIIIFTLIIGMIFGALISRAYMHHRIKRAFAMVNPARFIPVFEQTIKPTPEQRDQIRKIIRRHAKTVSELQNNLREGMESSFESLRKDLDAVLTPGQKKHLRELIRNRPPWPRRDRRPWPPRERPFPEPDKKLPPPEKKQKNSPLF
jgi:Spy/CpxP family protein refolding chaperone